MSIEEIVSKVEGKGVRLTPLECSCNYFFFDASRVKELVNAADLFLGGPLTFEGREGGC